MAENQDETKLTQLTLPGLELQSEELGPTGALRAAVIEQLAALSELNLLERRHVAQAQLALELADAVTAGRRGRRASAVAMAARELRETLLSLPQPAAGTLVDAFESMRAELAAAAEADARRQREAAAAAQG